MVGEREVLFETDTFIAYGELLKDPPYNEGKYHVWIYPKNHMGWDDEKLKDIIKNLKDFGKWGTYKKLKKELKEEES